MIAFTLITVRLNTLFNIWGTAADGGNLTDPLALDLLGFIVPEVDSLVVQTNALVPPAGDQDAASLLDTFKNLIGLHQQFFTLLQESISEQDVDKFAQALAARDAINQIDQDIFGGITVGLSLPPDRGGGFR